MSSCFSESNHLDAAADGSTFSELAQLACRIVPIAATPFNRRRDNSNSFTRIGSVSLACLEVTAPKKFEMRCERRFSSSTISVATQP